MSKDATKTEISELQQLEIEYEVRLRAYQLYEARGREDGHELEDWFRRKRGNCNEEIPNRFGLARLLYNRNMGESPRRHSDLLHVRPTL